MTRSPFGWSLPPGVTDRMIDEAAGAFDDDVEPQEELYRMNYRFDICFGLSPEDQEGMYVSYWCVDNDPSQDGPSDCTWLIPGTSTDSASAAPMTLDQQDLATRIGYAAGSAERHFQRAIGAGWTEAYEADWRVCAEIYELARAPARDIEFLGMRLIGRKS